MKETTFIDAVTACQIVGVSHKALRRITTKLAIKPAVFGRAFKFLRKDIMDNLSAMQAEFGNRTAPKHHAAHNRASWR